MADSSLLIESSGLDINENCSSNTEPLVDTAPSTICTGNDSAFIETSNTSENFHDFVKASEIDSELPPTNFDENPTMGDECNHKTDSGIHDFENNVIGSVKLIEFNVNDDQNFGGMVCDFSREENDADFNDEDFHDAAQFFKDPSSLVFLENKSYSSAPTEPIMARSSLYEKFDPLHAKFFSHSNIKSNELQEIAEDENYPEHENLEESVSTTSSIQQNEVANELQTNSTCDAPANDSVPVIVNNHISKVSPRPSLGNILISFDSPVVKDTVSRLENETPPETSKVYTEEEFQQALKIQELTIQEAFLKKQQELEETFSKRQQELETKLEQQKCLSKSIYMVLHESTDVISSLSDKEKMLKEKLETSEKENNKLKEDLKTSMEDIQSVETTFSDFHKRYEQCKNMLKVYTENEKSLKQQLDNLGTQLNEREEMYSALQSRTEEMLERANNEVATAKKAGDAQVAVLKAQLKKAEMKISSLESDVKHVKIENGKLSSICDELMAKVSES